VIDDLGSLKKDPLELNFVKNIAFCKKYTLAGRDVPSVTGRQIIQN
jgi:hypothetical protein